VDSTSPGTHLTDPEAALLGERLPLAATLAALLAVLLGGPLLAGSFTPAASKASRMPASAAAQRHQGAARVVHQGCGSHGTLLQILAA
jgi:hypothetical protein